jgi:uncharacterized membrane protein
VTSDQFFFLLEIFFQTVAVRYFVAPSLTRGQVYNLLLLLALTSAVPLGSALFDERSGLSFVSFVRISLWLVSMYIRYLHKIFKLSVFDTVQVCIYNMYKASFSAIALALYTG